MAFGLKQKNDLSFLPDPPKPEEDTSFLPDQPKPPEDLSFLPQPPPSAPPAPSAGTRAVTPTTVGDLIQRNVLPAVLPNLPNSPLVSAEQAGTLRSLRGVASGLKYTPPFAPVAAAAPVLSDIAKKIEPPNQNFPEKILSGQATNEDISNFISPSRQEILKEATQTGKVPTGKILESSLAEAFTGVLRPFIPTNPVQAGELIGFPKVLDAVKESFPLLAQDLFRKNVIVPQADQPAVLNATAETWLDTYTKGASKAEANKAALDTFEQKAAAARQTAEAAAQAGQPAPQPGPLPVAGPGGGVPATEYSIPGKLQRNVEAALETLRRAVGTRGNAPIEAQGTILGEAGPSEPAPAEPAAAGTLLEGGSPSAGPPPPPASGPISPAPEISKLPLTPINEQTVSGPGIQYLRDRFPGLAEEIVGKNVLLNPKQMNYVVNRAAMAGEEALLQGLSPVQADLAAIERFHAFSDPLSKFNLSQAKSFHAVQTAFDRAYKPNTNLPEDEKALQTKAQDYAKQNGAQILSDYEAKHGNVVNADWMRNEFAGIGYDGFNANAFHEPASALTKIYEQQAIDKAAQEGNKTALLLAGGSGSGKSRSLEKLGTNNPYGVTIDAVMANPASAKARIDNLLSKGFSVDLNYVYRDPLRAWEGNLKRGRPIPLDDFLAKHEGALETIKRLYPEYKDRVNIRLFHSNSQTKSLDAIPIEALDNIRYNKGVLKKELTDVTKTQESNGTINPRLAHAALSERVFPGGSERVAGTESGLRQGNQGSHSPLPGANEGIGRANAAGTETPLEPGSPGGTLPPGALPPEPLLKGPEPPGQVPTLKTTANINFKEYLRRYGDNRPNSVVKAEYEDLVKKANEGIQPQFTQQQIAAEADSLQRKFRNKHPGERLPSIEVLKPRALERLQRKFTEVSRSAIPIQRGLKQAAERGTVKGPAEALRYTEKAALSQSLRRQAIAAREAATFTKQQLTSLKKAIVSEAKDRLPLSERGKLLSVVASAKTPFDLNDAMDRIDAMVDRYEKKTAVTELRNTIGSIDLKKLRPEYRDAIKPIIDSVDPSRHTEATLRGLASLANFVEKNPDNQIPAARLEDLRVLSKRPIDSLTKEEVQDISDTILHLAKLNDLKNSLIIRGKLRNFDEIRKEATNNIQTRPNQPNDIPGLDSFQKESGPGAFRKIFTVESYNAELKSEILDGKSHGVIWDMLYKGIDDGVTDQLRFEQEAEDYFKAKLAGIDVSKWSGIFQKAAKDIERVTVPLPSGRSLTMTKGERMAFYLHSLNRENLRHLLDGGFAFENTPAAIVHLSEADLQAIVGSMTGEEKRAADAIHEYLNDVQKKKINAVSVNLLGYELAREPDYFPIRTHYLDRFRDELIKVGNYSQKTLEGMGIFKERQKAANALILEDAFATVLKSIKQVGAYVGLANPLRNAKSLLNDNEFQLSVHRAGVVHFTDSMKTYLRRIEGDSVNLDNVDKLTQDLINKLDVAILGLNPWVMAKQPISYMLAATEMDGSLLRRAFQTVTRDADIAEIKRWSPQLRMRFDGNVTRELGEVANVGEGNRFFTGRTSISQKIMEGIAKFDRMAIVRLWKAAKLEVARDQPELTGDAYFNAVRDRAEEVIRLTQPTFHIKDRSNIGMSRNVFIRLLTKYSSQRNKNYMILRRAYEKYNRSGKTARDKANLAAAVSLVVVVAPLLLAGLDAARDVAYSRPQRNALFKHAANLIQYTVGDVYFLGDFFNSFMSKIEKGNYAGYDVNNPVSSTMNDLVNTLVDGTDAIRYAVTNERYRSGPLAGDLKWKPAMRRFASGAIDLIGKFKGIPVHTIRRFLGIGARLFK